MIAPRNPENARLAEEYLSTAGVWDRVRYRVGDALAGFAEEAGDFDVVYCDVDKDGYPDCWRAARTVFGLVACGCVTTRSGVGTSQPTDKDGEAGVTAFIWEHNRPAAEDSRYVGSIVSVRDGVLLEGTAARPWPPIA